MSALSNAPSTLINDLLDGAAAHADRICSNDAHVECLQELLVAAGELMSPDQHRALAATEIGKKLASYNTADE